MDYVNSRGKWGFLSIFLYFLQWVVLLPLGLLLDYRTTPSPESMLSYYSPPGGAFKYFVRCWPILDLAFSTSFTAPNSSSALWFLDIPTIFCMGSFTKQISSAVSGWPLWLLELPSGESFLTQGLCHFHEQSYESVAIPLHLHFCLLAWNTFFSSNLLETHFLVVTCQITQYSESLLYFSCKNIYIIKA